MFKRKRRVELVEMCEEKKQQLGGCFLKNVGEIKNCSGKSNPLILFDNLYLGCKIHFKKI